MPHIICIYNYCMVFVYECKKCWIYPRLYILLYVYILRAHNYRHSHTIINVSFCFKLVAFHLGSCNCHFLLTSLNSSLSSIWSMSILAATQPHTQAHTYMHIYLSVILFLARLRMISHKSSFSCRFDCREDIDSHIWKYWLHIYVHPNTYTCPRSIYICRLISDWKVSLIWTMWSANCVKQSECMICQDVPYMD